MTAFRIMFYAGLVLAILFLIAAVMIFFLLHVPEAFGVVTGRTQKKAIEAIDAGGNPEASVKKKSKIKTRVVGASQDTGYMRARGIDPTTTGALGKDKAKTGEAAKTMSDDEAKAAASAAAARSVAENASTNVTTRSENIQLIKNGKMNLDEETTDVLTYREMQEAQKRDSDSTEVLSEKKDDSEDSTDVLTKRSGDADGEEATNVLNGDDSGEATDVLSTGADDDEGDEATDVLTSNGKHADEEGEEATDVLSRMKKITSEESEEDEELDTVGSYMTDKGETKAHGEVHRVGETSMYGSTAADQTSVLVEDMANGPESTVSDSERSQKIRVLYKETIIHTDEFL